MSYEDGYERGLTWDSPWTPGGPWHDREDPEQRAAHAEWMRGFKDGLEQQKRTSK